MNKRSLLPILAFSAIASAEQTAPFAVVDGLFDSKQPYTLGLPPLHHHR